MKIQKGNFKFTESLEPLNLSKVKSIALHHMAHPTADENTVHQWHLGNGWLGIGYNYWIGKDGRIIEGRGLNKGAGVKDHNSTILSIGFQGDYDKEKEMPKEQFESGVWLINYIKEKVPSIIAVDGHNRWNPTSCPGRYFPLKEMIEAKPKAEPKEKPITVIVNGKPINDKMDVQPIIVNNRVMVPVRFVVEAFGAKVIWETDTKTVKIVS